MYESGRFLYEFVTIFRNLNLFGAQDCSVRRYCRSRLFCPQVLSFKIALSAGIVAQDCFVRRYCRSKLLCPQVLSLSITPVRRYCRSVLLCPQSSSLRITLSAGIVVLLYPADGLILSDNTCGQSNLERQYLWTEQS